MTGRAFQTRAAILALAVVAILSTGLPGTLHRLSAHAHAIENTHPAHAHACGEAADHHGHSQPTRERDHNHSEGSCDLCLMLATGGQWGAGLADVPWTMPMDRALAAPLHAGLVESLPVRVYSARGPPMISIG